MPVKTVSDTHLSAQTIQSQQGSNDPRLQQARQVLAIEMEALQGLSERLDESFLAAIALLQDCKGRVIVTGMGKSGLIGKKIAATFSSTGTPALFLHPAEGVHGDLGVLMREDVVLAISNSGETPEILSILPVIKRFGLPLLALTGNPTSTLATLADVSLDISVPQEACPMGLAPTASTTATLALGDTLAVVLLQQKGFQPEDFALFHPAGALGKRLLYRVSDLMHTGNALPILPIDSPFLETLVEMSAKKLGVAILVNGDGSMQGVLTDGDVRRALMQHPNPQQIVVKEVMTRSPKTISASALAVEALRMMEAHQITVLLVVADAKDTTRIMPVGLVHLHDLLQAGIA